MILVTGAAGFIGFHVARRLLDRGESVVGVDCFNTHYDPTSSVARAAELEQRPGFSLARTDIADPAALSALVNRTKPRRVVHLAAQTGVRYSLENPFVYERSNVAGYLSVLEACRAQPSVEHLVYASSSSVYGERSDNRPFREDDALDTPVSLYAATKRAAELMSATYARVFGIPQTGLRFFTVYGPWGRPDMAYFAFTHRIWQGQPIEVFGDGSAVRDFTYIDDVVESILAVLDRPPSDGGHRILNVGGGRPVSLLEMIDTLEDAIGRPAQKVFLTAHTGDVTATWADASALAALTGYRPGTLLPEGLRRFVSWYAKHRAPAETSGNHPPGAASSR
jgi:UDP-glucuronate 4-epimerase